MPPVHPILKRFTHQLHKAVFPADFPQAIEPPVRKANGSPSALRSYLDYYRKLQAPGFAVLVTGEWGTGKSHQVIHSLDSDEFFHVSLFGMRTADELRSAVFAQMYPTRHRIKGLVDDAKQSMHAVSGLLSLVGFAPALASAFLDKTITAERTLIFDDLERSRMPLKVLLGVINNYVEHSGCRVIVIVHDKKLIDPYLNDAKEKLFGQTIEALPQIAEAFGAFTDHHRNTAFGAFLAPHEETIQEIFKTSTRSSLRLLKYLIEDLRRFYEVLEERHLKHTEAMEEAIKMICVFAIEARVNGMIASDFMQRDRQAGADKQSKIAVANALYGTIRLESTTLQDEVLTDMFIRGIFDGADIRRSLDESVHFVVAQDLPPWRIVIDFDRLDDDKVEIALERMNAQIDNLEEIEPGVMLHILALRLMMAEQAISGKTAEDTVAQSKAYIDAMDRLGRIPPRPLNNDWRHERFEAHGGVGYWVSDQMKPRFKEIVDHLRETQATVLERKLLEVIPELLESLKHGETFFEMLVSTYTGKNPYAHVAILDRIEADTFVKAWLAAPKESWYWIQSAISERYKSSFHTPALKRERPWSRQVVALLEEELKSLEGFARYRLSRAIPKNVGGPEDDEDNEPEIRTVAVLGDTPAADVAPVEAAPTEPSPEKTIRRRASQKLRPVGSRNEKPDAS